MSFAHLGVDEGLSHSTVIDFAQTGDGMIWIANGSGIDRYDGYDFQYYRHNTNDPFSLPSNEIQRLMTDSHGNLWAGTTAGLALYDPRHDGFLTFRPSRTFSVTDIVELDSTHLLINANHALTIFNLTDRHFRRIGICRNHLGTVNGLTHYGNEIFISSSKGIYRYDHSKKRLTFLPIPGLKPNSVRHLYRSREAQLWIATEGFGLYSWSTINGSVRHYTAANSALLSDYVRAVASDKDGRLWIGTLNGLNILALDRTTMSAVTADPIDASSLSQSSVRCLLCDDQGGMWIGTYFGGVNYYHPLRNRFSCIRHVPGKNSLGNDIVSCIVQDGNQRLWIGTNNGLNIYNPAQDRFEEFTTSNGLRSNDIKAIRLDPSRRLCYVGSQLGGLAVLGWDGGVRRVLTVNSSVADDNSIYAIQPLPNGKMLLGSLTGLKLFEPDREAISYLPPSLQGDYRFPTRVKGIFLDRQQRYWVSGDDGLAAYQLTANGFKAVRLPLSKDITHAGTYAVFQDHTGRLWIGSQQGIVMLSPDLRHHQLLPVMSHGLPNSTANAFEEDDKGNIWLSTGNGLACLDPTTLKAKTYTTADGLSGNQFLPKASAILYQPRRGGEQ